MQTTRWAMVGTGFMLELIGHDFARTGNVELQVIVSRTAERAASAAREFGFPEGSDDLDAVLRRDDIDVVYVATPHSEHFTQAKAAIEAGKHVLVEKSMTPSASSTTELCALAESRGVFAMEAMWTAFNPAVIELRRRVLAGQLGDIRVVHANFCTFVPYRPESRLWAKDLAGGSTLDQGVYTLTFAHMILGPPSSVTARGTVVHGVDAEVAVVLDYESGSCGVCVSSLRAHSPLKRVHRRYGGLYRSPRSVLERIELHPTKRWHERGRRGVHLSTGGCWIRADAARRQPRDSQRPDAMRASNP